MPKKIDTEGIMTFIKSSQNPVTKKEILDACPYGGDFSYAMKTLMSEYKEIEKVGNGKAVAYTWKPAKEVYSEMKNPEGYPDSTAGKAIANMLKSNGRYPMRQEFGEVWSTSTVSDDMEGILVIAAKEGTVIGYNVYGNIKPFMKQNYIFDWKDSDGTTHCVCTLNPINIPERKLGKRKMVVTETEKLKQYVSATIGLTVVENTVTEVKEVPNAEYEKQIAELKQQLETKEAVTTNTVSDVELAVLKAKLEVYERLVEAWMKR